MAFPIEYAEINWDRLITKRMALLATPETMPKYLLKPEVLNLLAAETHPMHRLIVQVGVEPPFKFVCHTFRHSFAVHLLLRGRPLKFVGQLLGYLNLEPTEAYANVLMFDGAHFLEGVESH